MSSVRKLKSTGFFVSILVVCFTVIIVGLLEIFKFIPPHVFSLYVYAAMLSVSALALLHNILNFYGLVEKEKHDKLILAITCTLGVIATAVIILAWYFTFIV